MARLTRKNIKVFAESASNNGVFGSLQAGNATVSNDVETIQSLAEAWSGGWNYATMTGEKLPPLEEFQGIQYVTTYQQAYIMQEGMPEWSASVTYYKGSLTKKVTTTGFQIYSSLTDNNINHQLSDTSNWKLVMDSANLYAFDNAVVHLAGAETITGTKTFTANILEKANIQMQSTTAAKGTAPESPVYQMLAFYDKNGFNQGNKTAQFYTTYVQSNNQCLLSAAMEVFKPVANSTDTASIKVYYPETGNAYTSAPTPTDTTTTSGTQIATTGWVNSVGNNVVHLSGTETITGSKTFTSYINEQRANPEAHFINTMVTTGTAPEYDQTCWVRFTDTNDRTMGAVNYRYLKNTKGSYLALRAIKSNASSDTDYADLGVSYPASGNPYASAPHLVGTIDNQTNGGIVTQVSNSRSSNGYFKFGNGMIVQWGKTGNLNNNASSPTSTTFPTPFASSNYKVILTVDNGTSVSNEYGLYVVGKTTTAFTAIARGYEGGSINKPAAYIAIGY